MTEGAAIQPDGKCNWCGKYHGVQCPEVKALEFHENGTVKRVEFRTAVDYPQIDWERIDVGNIAYASLPHQGLDR